MKQIIISHRGNLDGPNSCVENHPDSIAKAIEAGFSVEVDVWLKEDGKLYLGHDGPQYEIDHPMRFLSNDKLWIHCKNIQAIAQVYMILLLSSFRGKSHVFLHQSDDAVLTSNGFIFTAPGKELTGMSIAVMPEWFPNWDTSIAAGVCTDFPRKYV